MALTSFVLLAHTCSPFPNLTWTHRVPVQFLDVHEDSHELRDGHGGMSVIQLDGDLENRTPRGDTGPRLQNTVA